MNSAIIKTIFLLLGFAGLFFSCKKDKDDPDNTPASYSSGVFIINEGNYGTGSGTLTFIKRDGSGLVNKAFQSANPGMKLGNIAQSMSVIGDRAFILVNNSNRVVVCNKNTLKMSTSIENIYQPRYLIKVTENSFAVTCWDNKVRFFDSQSLTQSGEVVTGTGPEKMLMHGGRLWILNQGGLGVDSTITIINPENFTVQTVQVYPRPTGIQQDHEGNIWVMCSGRKDYHPGGYSPSHLICIDSGTYGVVADFPLSNETHDAIDLEINQQGTLFFFLYKGDVYIFDIVAGSAVDSPFVDSPGTFYSLGYDPFENTLYTSDALNYTQNGVVNKYDAATGAPILNFTAGIIPGEYYFTEN